MDKTCSCFGHFNIEITDSLKEKTEHEIDLALLDGVRIFLFGGRSDFDDLCYELVTKKKQEHPEMSIQRVFCFPMDKHLHKPPRWFQRKDYEAVECPIKDFDWWYTAIYYRNCAMVDKSDLVLFCVEQRENSGAYKTYDYAVKKKKKVVNLY